MPEEIEVIDENKTDVVLPDNNVDLNIDNSDLIDFFIKEKELEDQEKEEQKTLEEQRLIEEEEYQEEYERTTQQLLDDEVEFREELLKELNELKTITYEMSLASNEFDRLILNENVSLHNDFYIFIGIFISAFVTLIFARSWFGNAL